MRAVVVIVSVIIAVIFFFQMTISDKGLGTQEHLSFYLVSTSKGEVAVIECRLVSKSEEVILQSLIGYLVQDFSDFSRRPQIHLNEEDQIVITAKDKKNIVSGSKFFFIDSDGNVFVLTKSWDPSIVKDPHHLAEFVDRLLVGNESP